jgi:hypothetical protein
MNKAVKDFYKILKKPLSERSLKRLLKNNGRLSVNIAVDLNDLICIGGINGLNDLADELIIDLDNVVASLSDISYEVVGHITGKPGQVIINVCADVDF